MTNDKTGYQTLILTICDLNGHVLRQDQVTGMDGAIRAWRIGEQSRLTAGLKPGTWRAHVNLRNPRGHEIDEAIKSYAGASPRPLSVGAAATPETLRNIQKAPFYPRAVQAALIYCFSRNDGIETVWAATYEMAAAHLWRIHRHDWTTSEIRHAAERCANRAVIAEDRERSIPSARRCPAALLIMAGVS